MEMRTILLVEDDPEDREILLDALESIHVKDIISFAENGEEALALLEKCAMLGKIPNVIVIDINMPRMGGTQTLQQLKKDPRYKHIPVIIYSTSINPLEKAECMLIGAYSYIIKPVSFKESLDVAQYLIDLSKSASFA